MTPIQIREDLDRPLPGPTMRREERGPFVVRWDPDFVARARAASAEERHYRRLEAELIRERVSRALEIQFDRRCAEQVRCGG